MLKDDQEMFVDKSMHEILPWCMAQHFSVRLYAQVIIFIGIQTTSFYICNG